MKTRAKNPVDEMRPAYDLAPLLRGGVKGKHAAAYAAGTNLVLLDPEVHSEFKTAKDVNEALRLVIELRKLGRRRATR